jgi:uncharacterized protein
MGKFIRLFFEIVLIDFTWAMVKQSKSVSLARLGKLLLLSGLTIYLTACTVMAFFQRSLIYHPRVFTREQVNQRAQATRLGRWTNSAGEFIGFKQPSPRQPADGIVLITYGNGSTAVGCDHYANDIQSVAAFDVFILEYPGYEDRPGKPSQTSLFAAATEAFQMLPTNKPIYLVGESLGTGVASYLAGTHSDRVAGMLLISPFNNLTGVAQSYFPFLPVWLMLEDRFPSEKYLHNYHGKVEITVDGEDGVVPEKFGLRLYDSYYGPKKLWEFPSGEHCEIMEKQSKFWNEVVTFWQTNHTPVK